MNKKQELLKKEEEIKKIEHKITNRGIKSTKPDNIFISGYFHTGTNWLNNLIIENTPSDKLYMLMNQHTYISDNNTIERQGKHGKFKNELLSQKKTVIIYLIRDFETWLPSFLSESFGMKINNGILNCHYGWGEMNIYDLYCHIINTNVKLLRESKCNYIIGNLAILQKTKGYEILNLLEKYGFEFSKPYKPIDKHTKINKIAQNRQRSSINLNLYIKKINNETESYVKKLSNNLEYYFI